MPERQPPPGECANCGAAIPPSAQACPECGADERTGWREASVYDDLDLPATAYEDDADDGNRLDQASPTRINGVAWYWWLAAVILLLAVAATMIGGL